MKIRAKLFLPLALLAIVLGLAGYAVLTQQFRMLERSFITLFVESKIHEAHKTVRELSESALQQAAAFSRMPAVVEAFEIAGQGDMDDEADPMAQEARELLRAELGPVLDGYEQAVGSKLQVHFHLPTARSLARMWREKQAKRGGQWVDVSDDLSGFRETVLTVNRDKKPVMGIEPGRGGFTIRGLAPVVAPDGHHLGSVEVLVGFSKVLSILEETGGAKAMLFMNHDKLAITTKLQDPDKYPVVEDAYVLIHGKETAEAMGGIDLDLLSRAREGDVIDVLGATALGAFPVRDYKGEVIGVAVLVQDIGTQQSMVKGLMLLVSIGLGLVVLLPFGFTLLVVQRTVMTPVDRLSRAMKDISDGDLSSRVEVRSADEIGRLGLALNGMAEGLQRKAELAQTIAEGDITHEVALSSDKDMLGHALSEMTDNLNNLLGEVRDASRDVDNASRLVSESSGMLSDGATKQASSMEETSSSLTEITGQTKENADNANVAREKAESVSRLVAEGQRDMRAMVEAMGEVSRSSEAIARIIKVIDEIAFQTNLLALNAAVEAARAGQHGKGFAVVAEEVRNLAGRSAKAAQETAQLIEGSVDKVVHTNKVVEQAASSLEAVVEDVEEMAALAQSIANASGEQSRGLVEINDALGQIDQVTQSNTASAEETSAASQELSSQATRLHQLVSRFRLKDGSAGEREPQPEPPSGPQPPKASSDAPHDTPQDAPQDGWGEGPGAVEVISLDDDEFGKY